MVNSVSLLGELRIQYEAVRQSTHEFRSTSIEEPILEDLARFMLGRDTAFLHRAPLTGIHGQVLDEPRAQTS